MGGAGNARYHQLGPVADLRAELPGVLRSHLHGLAPGGRIDHPVVGLGLFALALADLTDVDDDGRFLLRGRQADLLEIAGTRASWATARSNTGARSSLR